MKKLGITGIALALVLLAEAMPAGPIRFLTLVTGLVLSASVLIYDTRERRTKGQSWNDSLAGNTKLITGNVWLDGLVFAAIIIICVIVVVLVLIYA